MTYLLLIVETYPEPTAASLPTGAMTATQHIRIRERKKRSILDSLNDDISLFIQAGDHFRALMHDVPFICDVTIMER
jgi:hypothetical protein